MCFSSPTCISQNTLAAERLENIEMEEKLKTSTISSEITTFKTVGCVCVSICTFLFVFSSECVILNDEFIWVDNSKVSFPTSTAQLNRDLDPKFGPL